MARYGKIYVDFNKKPNIIQDILIPKYPNLTVLYLGDNNIISVELLACLDSPMLQKLFLSNLCVI